MKSRNSYSILITVLSKCLLEFFVEFPPDWDCVPKHNLLSIAEEIAPLDTIPAFLLFPFLLPSFFSEEANSFPSLLRCFPLFVSTFPGVSPPVSLQSLHDWIRWVFCHSHQSPSFPANLAQTAQALELHWLHETMRDDFPAESFVDRLAENEPILRSFVMSLLSRLSTYPERTHQFSLQVMRHLIDKKPSLLMECLFPAEHRCDLAEGCVTILCGISETAFRSLVSQGENVTRFLEDVLCAMNVCISPRERRVESEMEPVRALEYQLRERILQRLRFLLQNKVWRENRLFASIRSLFPECCVVCWINDEFSLSFLVTYEAKDSIAKMNSNIRKQHRKETRRCVQLSYPVFRFTLFTSPNKHTTLATHSASSPESPSTPPASTTSHFPPSSTSRYSLRANIARGASSSACSFARAFCPSAILPSKLSTCFCSRSRRDRSSRHSRANCSNSSPSSSRHAGGASNRRHSSSSIGCRRRSRGENDRSGGGISGSVKQGMCD